jgi:hemoglobin-like flavoprotein
MNNPLHVYLLIYGDMYVIVTDCLLIMVLFSLQEKFEDIIEVIGRIYNTMAKRNMSNRQIMIVQKHVK